MQLTYENDEVYALMFTPLEDYTTTGVSYSTRSGLADRSSLGLGGELSPDLLAMVKCEDPDFFERVQKRKSLASKDPKLYDELIACEWDGADSFYDFFLDVNTAVDAEYDDLYDAGIQSE